jgi:hypothetical protein
MGALTQKRILINTEQKRFLENHREWGFPDQSSIVREALDRFIEELRKNRRRTLMAQKAQELLSDYIEDKELTVFTELDYEDFQ